MKQVILNVDDEVQGVAQALIDIAKDIKSQAAVGQYMADLSKNLLPVMSSIANLGADLKAKPDNRAYLAMALEQMADAFLFPVAVPVPPPAV